MSQQMIFVDRIAFGGVLSLSKEIGKIRHSTVTLLLTTITEVLTDAHVVPNSLEKETFTGTYCTTSLSSPNMRTLLLAPLPMSTFSVFGTDGSWDRLRVVENQRVGMYNGIFVVVL